jgi:hypothetical protein
MAKKYYSVLDEDGLPFYTARNSTSKKECVETFFEYLVEGMDEEDEEEPFDEFSYKKKESYVESVHDIEEHEEKYPDDEADLDDVETKSFLHEYGESYTLNDDGGRYVGYRSDY